MKPRSSDSVDQAFVRLCSVLVNLAVDPQAISVFPKEGNTISTSDSPGRAATKAVGALQNGLSTPAVTNTLTLDNTNPYTPSLDYHPTTKKYVDEATPDLSSKADVVHTHLKADVGLSEVDNTSDINKPVSTAQQTALDDKSDKANVLELDNTVVFVPDNDHEPATKKYVDDATQALSSIVDENGDVVATVLPRTGTAAELAAIVPAFGERVKATDGTLKEVSGDGVNTFADLSDTSGGKGHHYSVDNTVLAVGESLIIDLDALFGVTDADIHKYRMTVTGNLASNGYADAYRLNLKTGAGLNVYGLDQITDGNSFKLVIEPGAVNAFQAAYGGLMEIYQSSALRADGTGYMALDSGGVFSYDAVGDKGLYDGQSDRVRLYDLAPFSAVELVHNGIGGVLTYYNVAVSLDRVIQ